ncbi:hypothetical protein DFP72DRAFT_854111 [Ephemerocybe angulata]|uniref:Uncharacterized protein n=1 Tax=Ephemerocybe angulata TaxID=980116 RepID=A0A8H6HL60_9AGAR|nr:hypothetical protein DFP72DRAFT_854111 [Tulosesus angulatus]
MVEKTPAHDRVPDAPPPGAEEHRPGSTAPTGGHVGFWPAAPPGLVGHRSTSVAPPGLAGPGHPIPPVPLGPVGHHPGRVTTPGLASYRPGSAVPPGYSPQFPGHPLPPLHPYVHHFDPRARSATPQGYPGPTPPSPYEGYDYPGGGHGPTVPPPFPFGPGYYPGHGHPAHMYGAYPPGQYPHPPPSASPPYPPGQYPRPPPSASPQLHPAAFSPPPPTAATVPSHLSPASGGVSATEPQSAQGAEPVGSLASQLEQNVSLPPSTCRYDLRKTFTPKKGPAGQDSSEVLSMKERRERNMAGRTKTPPHPSCSDDASHLFDDMTPSQIASLAVDAPITLSEDENEEEVDQLLASSPMRIDSDELPSLHPLELGAKSFTKADFDRIPWDAPEETEWTKVHIPTPTRPQSQAPTILSQQHISTPSPSPQTATSSSASRPASNANQPATATSALATTIANSHPSYSDTEEGDEKHKQGRLTNHEKKEADAVALEIFRTMKKYCDRIGRPLDLLLNILNKHVAGKASYRKAPWNYYQSYYFRHQAEENARCGVSVKAPTKAMFDSFKESMGPDALEFLIVDYGASVLDSAPATIAERERAFEKWSKEICTLVESGEQEFGFQGLVGLCGSSVNEDQGLGCVHHTPYMAGFEGKRLVMSVNDFIGHMKTHAYNVHSVEHARSATEERERRAANGELEDYSKWGTEDEKDAGYVAAAATAQANEDSAPAPSTSSAKPVPHRAGRSSSRAPSSAQTASQQATDHPATITSTVGISDNDLLRAVANVKGDITKMKQLLGLTDLAINKTPAPEVRHHFNDYMHALMRIMGTTLKGSGQYFQWKEFPELLGKAGVACVGWPHSVTFPGEESEEGTSKKVGMKALGVERTRELLKAMRSATLGLISRDAQDMADNLAPVIESVPVPGRKTYRCLYADGTISPNSAKSPGALAKSKGKTKSAEPSSRTSRSTRSTAKSSKGKQKASNVASDSDDKPLAPPPTKTVSSKAKKIEHIPFGGAHVRFMDNSEDEEYEDHPSDAAATPKPRRSQPRPDTPDDMFLPDDEPPVKSSASSTSSKAPAAKPTPAPAARPMKATAAAKPNPQPAATKPAGSRKGVTTIFSSDSESENVTVKRPAPSKTVLSAVGSKPSAGSSDSEQDTTPAAPPLPAAREAAMRRAPVPSPSSVAPAALPTSNDQPRSQKRKALNEASGAAGISRHFHDVDGNFSARRRLQAPQDEAAPSTSSDVVPPPAGPSNWALPAGPSNWAPPPQEGAAWGPPAQPVYGSVPPHQYPGYPQQHGHYQHQYPRYPGGPGGYPPPMDPAAYAAYYGYQHSGDWRSGQGGGAGSSGAGEQGETGSSGRS